jgi:hypothetical protein
MTPLLLLRSTIETAIDNIQHYLSNVNSNVIHIDKKRQETINTQLQTSLVCYQWVLEEINALLGKEVIEKKPTPQ